MFKFRKPVANSETPVANSKTPVANSETPVANSETPVANEQPVPMYIKHINQNINWLEQQETKNNVAVLLETYNKEVFNNIFLTKIKNHFNEIKNFDVNQKNIIVVVVIKNEFPQTNPPCDKNRIKEHPMAQYFVNEPTFPSSPTIVIPDWFQKNQSATHDEKTKGKNNEHHIDRFDKLTQQIREPRPHPPIKTRTTIRETLPYEEAEWCLHLYPTHN